MLYQDEFEVVWAGGPLLPPRSSRPSRIWLLGPPSTEDAPVTIDRPKRAYNKTNQKYWGKGQRDSVRPGRVDTLSEATIEGTRPAGDSTEHLLHGSAYAERTITVKETE